MKWKPTILAFTLAAAAFFGASEAPAETFAAWLDRHSVPAGQRGLDDDPAGDGITNLAKYALDLSPMVAARDGLPAAELVDGRLRLTVVKNPNAVGIGYQVLALSDLGGEWSADGLDVLIDDANSLVVEDTTGDPRRFLQLRVSPPATGEPDAYLYVVGGRVRPAENHPNFDKELDLVDTNLFENTGSGTAEERQVDVRSVLIADVHLETRTVSNWRRNPTYLPTNHPVDDGVLHWTYLHSTVQYHNGTLYAGPAYHNLAGGESASGIWSPTNFVVWAEVDPETGNLGEFTSSDPLPDTIRIAATAIAEVDGTAYFYVIGGTSGTSTERVFFAEIDSETGALGFWDEAFFGGLPGATSFNAAIPLDGGRILHTGGLSRGGEWEVATLESNGDIFMPWAMAYRYSPPTNTDENYPPEGYPNSDNRFEQTLHRFDFDEVSYIHIIGGSGTAVYFDELGEDGLPTRFHESPDAHGAALWDISSNGIPDVRRRASVAAYKDMIVVTGGTNVGSASYTATRTDNNFLIGTVAPDGNVTWMGNGGVPVEEGEALWAPRSFHGSVIVPIVTD